MRVCGRFVSGLLFCVLTPYYFTLGFQSISHTLIQIFFLMRLNYHV